MIIEPEDAEVQGVYFGALCTSISKQIPGASKQFDKDADAIVRLKIRGMLTDAEAYRARKRLLKRIMRETHNIGKSR